jgi:hypothetical protein
MKRSGMCRRSASRTEHVKHASNPRRDDDFNVRCEGGVIPTNIFRRTPRDANAIILCTRLRTFASCGALSGFECICEPHPRLTRSPRTLRIYAAIETSVRACAGSTPTKSPLSDAKIRNRDNRFDSHKHVQMIRHSIDLDRDALMISDDSAQCL